MKGGVNIHKFRAVVTDVIDGDTIKADCYSHFLDLEFKVKNIKFRLADIDTPETRGEERDEGLKVKEYVSEMILEKEVFIESHEKGSFGRYLAHVFYEGINVNMHLIEKGFAEPYQK